RGSIFPVPWSPSRSGDVNDPNGSAGASGAQGDVQQHGLWGGRFSGGLAPEMAALNLSLDVDRRLWREDLRGSRAWARALAGAGVLTADEADRLVAGLDAVEA